MLESEKVEGKVQSTGEESVEGKCLGNGPCVWQIYVIALIPIRDKLAKQINVEWRLPWSRAGAWCTAAPRGEKQQWSMD